MNIHTAYGFFQRRFRPKRIKALKASFPLLDSPNSTVLDMGGVASWWSVVNPGTRLITIINLDARHQKTCEQAGYFFMAADARELPFKDHQFDLVHSNSVIEHVGSFDDQRRFASEMLRCGKAIYLQTPNHWFPVEPHLMTVFIHWLPFSVKRHLVRWFSAWGWINRPTQAKIDEFLRDIRLLTRHEVETLFPGCSMQNEKFMGLVKSFVVVRPSSGQSDSRRVA
jgi:hypothetical protein